MSSAPVLVTGSAGFIGFHVARRLLERGETVVGLDNLNPYYEVSLKEARLAALKQHAGYRHHHLDLAEGEGVAALFEAERPDRVVHLAAQAGIRYSVQNPATYIRSNIDGFLPVLEGCRAHAVRHLVFASTSSVYGANGQTPYSVDQGVAHPLNVYAATKIANEAMAHAYAHLFGIPSTGLRFFTVYGPWGRPDMALFKFTRAILEGRAIDVHGDGEMVRDFTYIDDIVEGVLAALDQPATSDPAWSAAHPNPATSGVAPWRLLNLGAGRPIDLMRYIRVLEDKLQRPALIKAAPVQEGEMLRTEADIGATCDALGYRPQTPVEVGVGHFVDWYLDFYDQR